MCTQSKLKLWFTDSTEHSLNTVWQCLPLQSIASVLWPDWWGPALPPETSLHLLTEQDDVSISIFFPNLNISTLTDHISALVFINYGAADRIRTQQNKTEQNLASSIAAAEPYLHFLILINWFVWSFQGHFSSIEQMLERVSFYMTSAVKGPTSKHIILYNPSAFWFIVWESQRTSQP